MRKLNALQSAKLVLCFAVLLFASCNGGILTSPDPESDRCESNNTGTITLINTANAQASLEILQEGQSLSGVMLLAGGQHSALTLGAGNYTIEWGFGIGVSRQEVSIQACSSQSLPL